MNRASDIITVYAFALLIATPAVAHVFQESSSIRKVELRSPARFPATPARLTDLATYPEQLEAYVNDHFGLRSPLVFLHSAARLAFGESGSSRVVVGKDGWLFYDTSNVVQQARGADQFTNSELSHFVAVFRKRAQLLRQRGIPMLLVIAPNKHTIYRQFLPDHVTTVSEVTRMDQLVEALDAAGDVDYVDLRQAMQEAALTDRVYHKTDSHWNAIGAFHAYQEIMGHVQRLFPGTRILDERDFTREHETIKGKDLANMLNLQSLLTEESVALRPTSREQLAFGRTGAQTWIGLESSNPLNVLIIMDSYGLRLFPYLSRSFQRLYRTRSEHLIMPMWMVKEVEPDLVIYEIVERRLNERPSMGRDSRPSPR